MLTVNKEIAGYIAVADRPRLAAIDVVAKLKAM